jgi:hypothetical protein
MEKVQKSNNSECLPLPANMTSTYIQATQVTQGVLACSADIFSEVSEEITATLFTFGKVTNAPIGPL